MKRIKTKYGKTLFWYDDGDLISQVTANKYLLKDADLKDADLKGVDLEGANLEGANLEDANLETANLHKAYLKGANLKGANLHKAYLKGVDLEGANLDFSCLSLSCGSLLLRTDRRQRVQLAFCRCKWFEASNDLSQDEKEIFNFLKTYANEFHRNDVKKLK